MLKTQNKISSGQQNALHQHLSPFLNKAWFIICLDFTLHVRSAVFTDRFTVRSSFSFVCLALCIRACLKTQHCKTFFFVLCFVFVWAHLKLPCLEVLMWSTVATLIYVSSTCVWRRLLWVTNPHLVNITCSSNCVFCIFVFLWAFVCVPREILSSSNGAFLDAAVVFFFFFFFLLSLAQLALFFFQLSFSDGHPGGELWPDNRRGASWGGWSVQSPQRNHVHANEQSPRIHRDSPRPEGQEKDR